MLDHTVKALTLLRDLYADASTGVTPHRLFPWCKTLVLACIDLCASTEPVVVC